MFAIPYDPDISIPDSFPRGEPEGGVGGAQQKFLARRIGGRFVCGATHNEVRIRYLTCADYINRITSHIWERLPEVSIPMSVFIECLLLDFSTKGFSQREAQWMSIQVQQQVCSLVEAK